MSQIERFIDSFELKERLPIDRQYEGKRGEKTASNFMCFENKKMERERRKNTVDERKRGLMKQFSRLHKKLSAIENGSPFRMWGDVVPIKNELKDCKDLVEICPAMSADYQSLVDRTHKIIRYVIRNFPSLEELENDGYDFDSIVALALLDHPEVSNLIHRLPNPKEDQAL